MVSLSRITARQYISVYINDDALENQEIRQYSLTQAPDGKTYRIAVKREDKGTISGWLHANVQEGDVVRRHHRWGFLPEAEKKETPVVLISAGVGLTPMMAMLQTLAAQQHPADVTGWHRDRARRRMPLREEVNWFGTQLPAFQPDRLVQRAARG